MDRQTFEQIVRDVIDGLPDRFHPALENVAIVVEEEPDPADGELFGVYVGVPLTERSASHTGLPDRIVIFRGPILRACSSLDEVAREIRDTVVHELGHHFGLDDDEMPY